MRNIKPYVPKPAQPDKPIIVDKEPKQSQSKLSKTYKGLHFGKGTDSSGINLKWPFALQPFFHIETCTFCEKH